MNDFNIIPYCFENGYKTLGDGYCVYCNEKVGECMDCHTKTDNVNLLCDNCNLKALEENDRLNDQAEIEYGHLRNL